MFAALSPFRISRFLFCMGQNYKVSEYSHRSYSKLKESGRLNDYKTRILAELQKRPATRRFLAKLLKAGSPSNLCAPLKELENQGLISVTGSTMDEKTGREVSVYSLLPNANCLYINSNLSTCSLHSETSISLKKDSL